MYDMTMKKGKGFTLIELIIVIVIIGILTIVVVPIMMGYVKKAKETEAKTLLNQIATFEKVYFMERSCLYTINEDNATSFDRLMNIDARGNSYYTKYYINVDATNGVFSAVAMSTEPLTMIGSATSPATFISYSDTVTGS